MLALLLCLSGLGFGVFLPVYLKSVQSASDNTCIDSQKDLARGLTLYAMDNDGHLPDSAAWSDAIKTNVYPESFQCVNDPGYSPGGSSYAFATALSKALLDGIKDPGKTPMVFDAASGQWNLAGDISLLPNPGRHQGKSANIVGYADGSVKPRKLSE